MKKHDDKSTRVYHLIFQYNTERFRFDRWKWEGK